MSTVAGLQSSDIRNHYDLSTFFYWLLWGPHIHHGLWEGEESAGEAQVNLIRELARHARISAGDRVLDVGCGMGGSTIHLARHYGAQTTGITLSPLQGLWARNSIWWRRLAQQASVRVANAEQVEFPEQTFDVVWSVECTEHLFDKESFFRRAASWIRPGGRISIGVWLAGPSAENPEGRRLVDAVCEGFLCPSLGSRAEYRGWMERAGLVMEVDEDWTDRVLRTWEICLDRVQRSRVRWLARLVDRNTVQFLDHFGTILEAYRTRAMEYGCLVARRPSND